MRLRQVPRRSVPALTAAQMREVDRIMVEDLHIELVQMMENAGRNLAELAWDRFAPRTVTVLAGTGGNGGGGLVAARHLANRGATVTVTLSRDPEELRGVPAHQLDIVQRMGLPLRPDPQPADLVVDAVIGYSLSGSPEGRAAELIGWMGDQDIDVLSLDTPSGLDVTTGHAATPCVRATATLTLALPKVGLLESPQVGELYLGDISVPASVYPQVGVQAPPAVFADSAILRLR